MANRDVVICSPVRTAIGTYGGTYKEMPATDLGAAVVQACPAAQYRSRSGGSPAGTMQPCNDGLNSSAHFESN